MTNYIESISTHGNDAEAEIFCEVCGKELTGAYKSILMSDGETYQTCDGDCLTTFCEAND